MLARKLSIFADLDLAVTEHLLKYAFSLNQYNPTIK